MEAAAELLYAEGGDVLIADIARKAGVSSALVHAYFRSENDKRSTKDFIHSKIAATFFASLREIMSLILESQLPGTSSTLRLVAVYNALLRTAEKYPSFTRVVITNTWEPGRFGG